MVPEQVRRRQSCGTLKESHPCHVNVVGYKRCSNVRAFRQREKAEFKVGDFTLTGRA